MGILSELRNFFWVNFRSTGSIDDKIMIDNFVFLYKYLIKKHRNAFDNDTELMVFIMSFSLEHLKNESINHDFLLNVVRDIEKNTKDEDNNNPGRYKLYLLVFKTMTIYYQDIFFSKGKNNFEELAQKKLDTLNWYIAEKLIEYNNPISIDTLHKKDIVTQCENKLRAKK